MHTRYALPLCVAASLAAHLLLLSMQTRTERPGQAAHASSGSPGNMRLRLVDGVAKPETGAAAHDGASRPAPAAVAKPSPRVSSQASSRPLPAPAPPAEAPTTQAAENAPPIAAESGAPAIAVPVATSADDDYVPRPLLSVPPVSRSPVIIAAPEGQADSSRHVGILSLFIDEDGRVHHVAADDAALPPAFEQAAREAFMAARFSPGQIDGRLVKSRVRVEVVFDNLPLMSTRPRAVSQTPTDRALGNSQ